MTLLHMDAAQGGDVTTKYRSTATGTRATTSPRFTGGAYWHTASLKKPITASADVIAGGAFNQPSGVAAPLITFASDSGATIHVVIVRNTSLHLEARLGSTSGTVLATGTATLTAAAWAQVEARCVVSDTVGVVQIRINGSATPDINFSGDTRNGGTSTNIDEVTWSALNSSHQVTDIYALNSSGSVNTTWLGDQRVVALQPTAQGFYQAGVRANPTGAASTNWDALDEQPYNTGSGSDRVSVTTATKDSYLFADLPSGTPAVAAVQANFFVARDSVSAMTLQRLIRSGGADYLGTAISIPNTIYSFSTISEVMEVNPATSAAWAPTAVDALDLGMTGTGTGNKIVASAVSVEALIASFPPLVITIPITSSVTVDIPNEITVGAFTSVTVHAVGELAGLISITSTTAVIISEATTDYPRPEPSDPTIDEPDPDDEPVIEEVLEVWPAPTLTDGVPDDGWEAS